MNGTTPTTAATPTLDPCAMLATLEARLAHLGDLITRQAATDTTTRPTPTPTRRTIPMSDHGNTPASKADLISLLIETQTKATIYERLLDDLLNYLLLLEGRPAQAARDWQLQAAEAALESSLRFRPAAGQRQA